MTLPTRKELIKSKPMPPMPTIMNKKQQKQEAQRNKNAIEAVNNNIIKHFENMKRENEVIEKKRDDEREERNKQHEEMIKVLNAICSQVSKPMDKSNVNAEMIKENEKFSTPEAMQCEATPAPILQMTPSPAPCLQSPPSQATSSQHASTENNQVINESEIIEMPKLDLLVISEKEVEEEEKEETVAKVIDYDTLVKRNIKLENEITNLKVHSNIMVNYIQTLEKRINKIEKSKSDNQPDDNSENKNDEKPYEADKEVFPPLRKSLSVQMNKPKGKIVQSDSDMFINSNMNEARVVTSRRKRRPNYREMLEKDIENETIKIDKSKIKPKNNNIITMTQKDNFKEAIMLDMKRTFGVETKHERHIDITIKAMEKEKKIDPNITYKEKESAAMKAIIENFVLNEAKIDKDDWEAMLVEKFHVGIKKQKDNSRVQVIYCRMVNPRDVNLIKSKMADKDQSVSSKLVNYVHQSAYQRWKIFDNMAWQYRRQGKSTKIYHGKTDFLLLVKEPNDPQKWADIAPRFVPEKLLVDFDIGKLSEEDEEYYTALQNDRFEENIARNEALKDKINDENMRIDDEYDENRYFPCSLHHEPDCESCYYPEEQMIRPGQSTQVESPAPPVENENIIPSDSESPLNVSIQSI